MLSQTKENIQNIIQKIQVLDFTLQTLGATHKDHVAQTEVLIKQASVHKLKLVSELLTLSNAGPVSLDVA